MSATRLPLLRRTGSTMLPSPGTAHGLLHAKKDCGCGGGCPACRAQAGPPVQSLVHRVIESPGSPLDPSSRRFFESRLGHDFSRVRVHDGVLASQSTREAGAVAYSVGHHVVFRSGMFAPETPGGRELLAHELAHVVQQEGFTDAPQSFPVAPAGSQPEQAAHRAGREAVGPGPVSPVGRAPGVAVHRQEELSQVWRVGPLDALSARSDAQTALSDARATGLDGPHNGPQDAWRHCYWNCLMTRSIGEEQAATVADTHEEFGSNPANEETMDLHNNSVGRTCGAGSGGCWSCCSSELDTGGLLVIPDWAGAASETPVPSGPSGGAGAPPSGSGYSGYY